MSNPDFFTRMIALNALGPNIAHTSDGPETVWICEGCDAEHDDEDDARDCCRPSVSERYRCRLCRKLHRDEGKAEICHSASNDTPAMQCPICMRCAESFEFAADCCLHTHSTMTGYGRGQVAAAVAAGASWADAIKAHSSH